MTGSIREWPICYVGHSWVDSITLEGGSSGLSRGWSDDVYSGRSGTLFVLCTPIRYSTGKGGGCGRYDGLRDRGGVPVLPLMGGPHDMGKGRSVMV